MTTVEKTRSWYRGEADAPATKGRDGGGKNGCNEVAFTADNDPESQLDGETRGEGSTTIQWNFHGICTYKETEDG